MNSVLIPIILVPIIEIYLFIKIGSQIGAFNTISLIFITAIIGVFYARYEGLNTLRSGFSQIIKKPRISVANPGIIKSKAPKAIAAPEIIS